MVELLFSDDVGKDEWPDKEILTLEFGSKAVGLTAIPKHWTPPYAILTANATARAAECGFDTSILSVKELARLHGIASQTGHLYVRSSVVGETIWDRGTYESILVAANHSDFNTTLVQAIKAVAASAPNRKVGIVFQSYIRPRAKGEFGNLISVSKTRDHWELSSETANSISRTRLNTQRDEAADAQRPLKIKSGVQRERLFGSIAAWLNNVFMRGKPQRLNCEWLADHHRIYIVQIDEEEEDFHGFNPFQLRVEPTHQPLAATGTYLRYPACDAFIQWDKLVVLSELWEENALHKPTLFYVEFSNLPVTNDSVALETLSADFENLIGPNQIIVRTSIKAGAEKLANLPRTEGKSPAEAAKWCLETRDRLLGETCDITQFAFVAHRFIAARAAAWVKADPADPNVEIHSLWGLPDALQYCAYDIWEVHIPTEIATEYPDYKSHMLISNEAGDWEYVRVKNEYGRSLSIGRREATELATRTAAIAARIGQACHVMWFVGCVGKDGQRFSIPWYWTNAHETSQNLDRSNYKIFFVEDTADLDRFRALPGSKERYAFSLSPNDQNSMRDMKFIGAVGAAAKELQVPVILAGSPLAHAYFELRRRGCAIISLGEKEHTRIRRNSSFGKIVRDKIPARIAQQGEIGLTRQIPNEIKKRFLISKLLEEALEVRGADNFAAMRIELADLLEVVRALAAAENISFSDVIAAADEKRAKAGGFDEGLVLLQTGLAGGSRTSFGTGERNTAQVLSRKISDNSYELPFTFFGFLELDQSRSLRFDGLGVRLDIVLKSDRIELSVSREAEQLELPLDLILQAYEEEN